PISTLIGTYGEYRVSYLYALILLIPVLATFLAFIPSSHWTIRSLDFPRVQIAVLCLLAVIMIAICPPAPVWLTWVLLIANVIALVYQTCKIRPYTRLARKEVLGNHTPDDNRTVSLLSSNVLTPNHNSQALLDLIDRYQPDLVLTLESDHWWQDALECLHTDYPHRVAIA